MTATSPDHGHAITRFREAYEREPDGVWHAPGRVNLIGEHTDYNDGFVLPFALPRGVTAAVARRDDDLIEVCSRQMPGDPVAVSLGSLVPGSVTGWAAYAVGAVWALRDAGHKVGGASLAMDSDLAQGVGLSSSAALECAVALALCELYGLTVPRPELASIARRAENEFVGMPSGIMDQAASLLGLAGHALLLDCRSLAVRQLPFNPAPADLVLLIIDTGVRHELVSGEYANRRHDCETAARLLGVPALRDVADLVNALNQLADPRLRKRVRHVVTENHRVQATVGLLRAGAIGEVGPLLTASHLSLRDDFEVSWPQADVAVQAAVAAGARGGRMIGGGFGGSVIALIPVRRVDAVSASIREGYAKRGWTPPRFFMADPAAGAHRITAELDDPGGQDDQCVSGAQPRRHGGDGE